MTAASYLSPLLSFLLLIGAHLICGTDFPFHHLSHGPHVDHGYHGHEHAHPYDFGYAIKDGHGSSNFHKESGDHANNKWGSYGIQDKDGRWRLVHYVADKHGFRVKIDSNEPGLISHHPAHAIITGPDAYGHPYHHHPHHEPHHHGHHHHHHPEPHYPHPEPHHHHHGHQEQGYHHVHREHHHKHKHHEPIKQHDKHEFFTNDIHDGFDHMPHKPMHEPEKQLFEGFIGTLGGSPQHHEEHEPLHMPHPPQHHRTDSLFEFIPNVPLGPPEGTLDFKKAASGIVSTISSTTTKPPSSLAPSLVTFPPTKPSYPLAVKTPVTTTMTNGVTVTAAGVFGSKRIAVSATKKPTSV